MSTEDLLIAEIADAFERYFELGVNRGTDEVAETLGLDPEVVSGWAEVHNWDQHVQERLARLQSAFTEEFGVRTMEISSELMGMVSDTLENFQQGAQGVPFDITSVEDFSKLSLAYERMCRAHALLKQSSEGEGLDGQGKTWADLLREAGEK